MLLVAFAIFAGYYTDWLWYDSRRLHLASTPRSSAYRLALFVVFFLVAGGAVVLNSYLAYRFRPIFRPISPEQQSLDRYRVALDPFRRAADRVRGARRVLLRRCGDAGVADTSWCGCNRAAFGQTDP